VRKDVGVVAEGWEFLHIPIAIAKPPQPPLARCGVRANGHQGGPSPRRLPANNRVIFNIKGHDYRLVVAAHYNREMTFIRFVDTHTEYDRIDATTI
jgi:uncharacterized protein (DUF1684 family)